MKSTQKFLLETVLEQASFISYINVNEKSQNTEVYVHLGSNHVEWNTAIIRPTTVTGKSMVSKCGSTQEIGGCRNSGHRREKTRDQTAMIIIVGHTRDFYFSSLRPLGGFQNSPGTCVRS